MITCPVCNGTARKNSVNWDIFEEDKIATLVCNNCGRILHFKKIGEKAKVVEIQDQEWRNGKELRGIFKTFKLIKGRC